MNNKTEKCGYLKTQTLEQDNHSLWLSSTNCSFCLLELQQRKSKSFLLPSQFSDWDLQIKWTKDRLIGKKIYTYVYGHQQMNSCLAKQLKLGVFIPNLLEQREEKERLFCSLKDNFFFLKRTKEKKACDMFVSTCACGSSSFYRALQFPG